MDICCTLVCFHKRTGLQNAVVLKTMLDIFIEILSRWVFFLSAIPFGY